MNINDVMTTDTIWAAAVGRNLRLGTVGTSAHNPAFQTTDIHSPKGQAAIWRDISPAWDRQLNLQVDNGAVYLFANNRDGSLDWLKATWGNRLPVVAGTAPFCRQYADGQLRIGLTLTAATKALAGHARSAVLADALGVLTYWHHANCP